MVAVQIGDVTEVLSNQGEYPRGEVSRHPEWVAEIALFGNRARDLTEFRERLAEDLKGVDDVAGLMVGLRHFKRRESLRVFWREVLGTASIRETTAEIAGIAEAALDASLRYAARFVGDESLADEMSVLGMGKLGGAELNFSSDVDLIFVASDAVRNRMEMVEEVARLVTTVMSEINAHGYVFRVDLRLRPHGTQGPLVPPVSSILEYYASWGRTWERGALLKARAVAGNLELGEQLLKDLEGFIFRRYLDFQAIEELRAMKEQINRQARASDIVGLPLERAPEQKPGAPVETPLKSRLKSKLAGVQSPRRSHGPGISATPKASAVMPEAAREVDEGGVVGWDVKIGKGGIREIEFFVQALQLVHCGTRPHLRVRNTLDALDRLLFAGLITADDHQVLAEAYAFFRRVEHRVQMSADRQGHRLPDSAEGLAQLSERMGMEMEVFRCLILSHRTGVHAMFSRLFESGEKESTRPTVEPQGTDALDTILGAETQSFERDGVLEPAPGILKALSSLGFERPRQVAGQILVLRSKTYGPFADRALAEEARLARYLLETAGAAPEADQAFSYLTRFITSIGDRPGYFRMLRDNPHACRLLVHVFGSSPYLSSALLREPAIVERLLGASTVAIVRSVNDMREDLEKRLVRILDPEHRIGVIRRFHQEETLRIGLHDAGGATTIGQTQEQLSLLAETVIRAVLIEVYEPLRTYKRREGSVLPPLEEIPILIVGMGKLGGRELSFGSDLDLLFVYENERQWRLEHSFFSRLAQRVIRTLSTGDGKMYEVDTRLRPSGQQGALVVSLEAFKAYHLESAELWERQALIRARGIAGSEQLTRTFQKIRTELVFGRPLPEEARGQIHRMLGRIREHTLGSTFDVKVSPGGLVEIEFAVQWLQLFYGQQHEELRGPSTMQALRVLEQIKPLDLDFRQLRKDYEKLRIVETRLRMTDNRGLSALPSDPREASMLARRLGYDGSQAAENMHTDLRETAQRVQHITSQIFYSAAG